MYHFRVKVIGRSSGQSAARSAAYRTGGRGSAGAVAYRVGGVLIDPVTGETQDYRQKGRVDADGAGVLHTEIMAPAGAAPWVFDLQSLINRVEGAEKRRDAQLFRELEVSLPRELSLPDQIALVHAFVDRLCVRAGMVAIISVHNERAADGGMNPHVHVLLTMRELTPDGFGPKVREWNARTLVREWREAWAEMGNDMLEARGFDRRLDHRSFKDRDLDLEPDVYVGPGRGKDFNGVIVDQRRLDRAAIKSRHGARALDDPAWVLTQLSRLMATFTEADIGAFLARYTDLAPDAAARVKSAALRAPELLEIAADTQGPKRFTTRELFDCEVRLAKTAAVLAERHGPSPTRIDLSGLSDAQRKAAQHVLRGPDLTAIEGVAGAGKSHLITRLRAAFEADGFRVRGAALSAIVARNLSESAGMSTQTLASLIKDIGRETPYAPLQRGDVLIVDEAGLVGSRMMEKVLAEVARTGARLILIGDTRQLQAIEAGAAFRAIVERHGAAQLGEVHRQAAPWQREATQDFAQGRTGAALDAYRAHGMHRACGTENEAMTLLVGDWLRDRESGGTQIILAHRRMDAAKLNRDVRAALRAEGRLGRDVEVPVLVTDDIAGVPVERRETRAFATGDKLLFTRNEYGLGVENGAIGEITALARTGVMMVRLADGREVGVDPRLHPYLEHGYALTVHKAQGLTVDRAYVFASDSFDAHTTYVAMTRHRSDVGLYYGRDRFGNDADLTARLSRERAKDTTLDYEAVRRREPPRLQSMTASRSEIIERPLTDREDRMQRAREMAAQIEIEREARRARGMERD